MRGYLPLLRFVVTVAAAAAVAVADGGGQQAKPRFVEEPANVTARVGERVVLPCKFANVHDGSRVQWTKEKFGLGWGLGKTDFARHTVVGSDELGTWDLEIDPVQLEDDTVYECQLLLGERGSLRSRNAHLMVLVPPNPPYIEEGPEVTVTESLNASFTCVSRGGRPAAKLDWYDQNDRSIDASDYRTSRMKESNGKLFESRSTITIAPSREHHDSTFRCEAWNEADGEGKNDRRPSLIRIKVQHPPSVKVLPVRSGLIQEGSKGAYRCLVSSNPPPDTDGYSWSIDDKPVPNQRRDYFEIYNVTRFYHNRQVRCSVSNVLGTANGLHSIQVKYAPSFKRHPETTAGDRSASVTLYCVVNGNPTPKYHWTRGRSREIISRDQNYTVPVTEDNLGIYYCHAEVPGYAPVTSRPAEVLMTGVPTISSKSVQNGVEGDNVNLDCAAKTIPMANKVLWKYQQTPIQDNSHYKVVNTAMEHGLRSTLIIRQALETDFGSYTCTVANDHGEAQMEIHLVQQKPLPLQTILIAVFSAVILVLLMTIILILIRKKLWCCCDWLLRGKKDFGSSSKQLRNGGPQQNNGKVNVTTMSQLSSVTCPSESDCDGGWSGDLGRTTLTRGVASQLNDPKIPPKPDVISTGYVPYGSFVRDYNPPVGSGGEEDSPPPVFGSSNVLNVSDPRFSATYGNPYLRQATTPYSTFLTSSPQPPPQLSTSFSSSSTTSQGVGGGNSNANSNSLNRRNGLKVSTVPTNSHYGHLVTTMSSSTPSSSVVSNMECLPEEPCPPELVILGEDYSGVSHTPISNLPSLKFNNLSGGSSSCTPSPPSLLAVNHPQPPNVIYHPPLQLHSNGASGDATDSLGFSATLNNNERLTGERSNKLVYTPLGINPGGGVRFNESNCPTYSTVNKLAAKLSVGSKNVKPEAVDPSNVGTHV